MKVYICNGDVWIASRVKGYRPCDQCDWYGPLEEAPEYVKVLYHAKYEEGNNDA